MTGKRIGNGRYESLTDDKQWMHKDFNILLYISIVYNQNPNIMQDSLAHLEFMMGKIYN